MDWIKIKPQYVLFSDLNDQEGYALVKLQCLTAHIEAMPTREQMIKVVHHKTLTSLQESLKRASRELQDILKKVLIDVQDVQLDREYWKERKRKQREKAKNVPLDVPKDVSNKAKLSIAKLSLDIESSTKTPKPAQLSDDQFMDELRKTYDWVNFTMEVKKMDAWLLAHPQRKKTRSFMVNWFNKCEKPMTTSTQKVKALPKVEEKKCWDPTCEKIFRTANPNQNLCPDCYSKSMARLNGIVKGVDKNADC